MKFFIINILDKIIGYSKNLDEVTLLANDRWVLFDETNKIKTVYIFRPNNQLLISVNGRVSKGNWDSLGDNTLLLDIGNESYLFKNGFIDEEVLILKQDSFNNYAIFYNETKKNFQLKTLTELREYLEFKYLKTVEKIKSSSASEKVTSSFINPIAPPQTIVNKIYTTDLAYKYIKDSNYIYVKKLTQEMEEHNLKVLGIKKRTTKKKAETIIIFDHNKIFTSDRAYIHIDAKKYIYSEHLTKSMKEHNYRVRTI